MNKYTLTNKDGISVEIETKREVNNVIFFYNTERDGISYSITKSKNAGSVLKRESGYNRPWLTNWHIGDVKKVS